MIEAEGHYRRRDGKMWIYVPNRLVIDSQFPLKEKSGVVKIRVEGKRLVLQAA